MQSSESRLLEKATHLRYIYRNGGASGVLVTLFYRLANFVTRLTVLRTAVIEFDEVNSAHLGRLAAYRHGFFSAEQLRRYAADPEIDLTDDFLDYAAAQGDWCYAIFEGDMLVNYCWNSLAPTRIGDGLHMEFLPCYYYRYKEYTRPSHRGRRLSSFNSAESLQLLSGNGKKGFAGYMEVDNCISYRSLLRKNHTFVGFIVILGKGPAPWIWHSPKARQWGFRVVGSGKD